MSAGTFEIGGSVLRQNEIEAWKEQWAVWTEFVVRVKDLRKEADQ